MKLARALGVALVLFVSVACTSTPSPSAPSSTGGASPTGTSVIQSETVADIVYNRGTPGVDLAVYSLDLETRTEHLIREVEDFVVLSPDGSRFLGG